MRAWLTISALLTLVGCVTTEPLVNEEQNYLNAGNYAGLIEKSKRELTASPGDPAIMNKLAGYYYEIDDLESASFYADQLLNSEDQHASLWFLRAKIAAKQERYPAAIQTAQQAKTMGYQAADADVLLGMAYSLTEQYPAAREAFNQARLKGYDEKVVKNNLALTYLLEGDYVNAYQRFERLHREYPAEDKIKVNLAMTYLKLGQHDEAHHLLGTTLYVTDEKPVNATEPTAELIVDSSDDKEEGINENQ
ncbi:tetratricopeptide repeat protein [Vibrio cholerae]